MVTIIVPVFNAEKFVDSCLIALTNQTFEDLEIIIVNDGSSDQTEVHCKKWTQLDSRVKYLKTDRGGVSNARNKGLEFAKGSYVLFCDVDDIVSRYYVDKLYHACIDKNLDICTCNYEMTYNENQKIFQERITENQKLEIFDNSEFIKRIFFDPKIKGYCWNKIFRRDVIENIRFRTELNMMEDLCYSYEVAISQSLRIGYIDCILYGYVQHEDNSSKQRYCIDTAGHLQSRYFQALLYMKDVSESSLGKDYIIDSQINEAAISLNELSGMDEYTEKDVRALKKSYKSFIKKNLLTYCTGPNTLKEKIKVLITIVRK